jgi:SAM-dependent methyltransferase
MRHTGTVSLRQALPVGLLPDYSRKAERYDASRSASPSILRVLRAALAGAPGPRLADVGGGTGNYALALEREGWEPVVVDRSVAMLSRAAGKGLETAEADAQRLPFADESFDAVTLISMLHHVEDPDAALAEARRILRRGSRLAVVAYLAEDAASLWVLDYFPSSRPWMEETHPPRAEVLERLPGAQLLTVRFEDMADASLAALSADPERVLKAAERGDTSFFERMRRDHREDLDAGLARLRSDIAVGRAPRHAGTATAFSWTKR